MRKVRTIFLFFILVTLMSQGECGRGAEPKKAPTPPSAKKKVERFNPKKEEVQPMRVETGEEVYWKLTTSQGEILIRLFPDKAPLNCGNIAYLTEHGFYDNTVFHRYVPGFVIQGGDPTGTGRGGPGYEIKDEISDEKFIKGTVGMANRGPNTNGSQFFICLEDAHHLDGHYTVIGRVVKGMDVVENLRVGDKLIKAEIVVKKLEADGSVGGKGDNVGKEKRSN